MQKELTLLEKYFPTEWEQLILPLRIKTILEETKNKSGYRLLLHSSPGTGKSTTSRLICKGPEYDVLYLSGSNDFNISVLRDKVYTFASGMSVMKKQKVIIIDEADRIRNDLQDAFKILLDKATNASFIFITNEISKINEAVKSRCTNLDYDFTNSDLLEHKKNFINFIVKVCKDENIQYDNPGVKYLFQTNFPDFRHVLVQLQQIKDSKDTLTIEAIKKFSESGKQMIELYTFLMNLNLDAKEFYFEASKFKGKEQECLTSLGEPFFQYLNDKGLYDQTLNSAIIVSKYSNMYLSTINKFTTFLSCLVELKTIFR